MEVALTNEYTGEGTCNLAIYSQVKLRVELQILGTYGMEERS